MKQKYVLLFAILMVFSFQSCIVSPKPNIDFFNTSYRNTDANYMSFNVPLLLVKPYIKKNLRKEEDNKALIDMVKKVKKIKIMTVENGNKKMLKDFNSYLSQNNYSEWMTVNSGTQKINIQAIQNGDIIKKLMLTINEGNDLVFIDVTGSFTPEDISNLINVSENNPSLIKKIKN